MYTVGQSISRCPLLVSGAVLLFHILLPVVQLAFHRVPLHHSPGSGQEVTRFQSSNGRHHNNKSSIHCHLAFVAVLHGILQKIIVEFRKKRKLVSLVCEDVQLEIHEMFLDRVHPGNFIQRDQPRVCVLELLQKLLIFHGAVSRGAAGRQICLQLFLVGSIFVVADRFQNSIVCQQQFGSKSIGAPFCL